MTNVAAADENDREIQFDRDVAPLWVRRCLDCHDASGTKGGLDLSTKRTALAGGDSGPAFVPGKPAQSLLVQRIDSDEMPPKAPLTAAEKAVLRKWIDQGAKWGADPIDAVAVTTEKRAGSDWWSLQPLKSVPPPDRVDDGVQNGIDRFIRQTLQAKGVKASPEADRRTLVRRLSFDLLGLPPSPDAVEAFVSDSAPDAYERLVDRMLASPQYGERWARHWLDVVRFGESQGFERDKLRPNAWRYRDWIVRAFNDDMPYHRFVRDQIAGDVAPDAAPEGAVATGFLVSGPYDEVGHTQQSEAMRKVVRQDELEDLLASIGQSFLGLTVNCARCHDHKFDPIRQIDYYRLAAAVEGVRHGERPLLSDALVRSNAERTSALGARVAAIQSQMQCLEESARRAILAERRTRPTPTVRPPKPIASWEFAGDWKDAVTHDDAVPRDGARIENGRLVVDGKGYVVGKPLKQDVREKTLEAWVQLSALDQQGGAVISVQSLDGNQFDAIVFGEREPQRWMAGSNFFLRSESFQGEAENDAVRTLTHVAIVYSADGTISGYRNGRPYGKPFKSRGLVKFIAGESQVVIGLRHTPPGGNKHLKATIDRVRLYDKALSPAEIAASAGVAGDFVPAEEIDARLSESDRQLRKSGQFEIAQLERLKARAAATSIYAVAPGSLTPTHLLHRGNPGTPRQQVTPGAPATAFRPGADFGLAENAPDAERRRKLAAWIAESEQPLFARVIVNRLWHYHFGVGIVETCNDFGFNGGRPSHPELLDWLAGQLRAHGYRLKPIHRLLVTSATYRQSSKDRPEASTVDAGNRLLWRRTPQRLEAEALRDAMLSTAGLLNEELGGPGFEDFLTFNANSQFYTMQDPLGTTFERRSLYRTWVRSGRSPFLDVFDCPDPSTFTPQRAVTTTPLQALSLLNNSFSLRMSERLAARIQREAGDDVDAQIHRGCRLLFGRRASESERQLLVPFVASHGLPALCRAWFNSNEFLLID